MIVKLREGSFQALVTRNQRPQFQMFHSGLGRVLLRALVAGACSRCAAKCHLRVSPEVSQCAEGGGAVIMLRPATILAGLALLAAEAGSLVSDSTTVTLLRCHTDVELSTNFREV